ncbi:hypothetical protein ABL78_1802 [Leptomonas seymouri]|uniref:Uncharacterized protein n=1 Tax=Leptomonas seymouri TaxID=5684 RepID=A0A0N0P7R3_LEPSE|nr:hypothetical protein ABL78_1802 [Leptomonas seymouri]|eukprot:KPI89066.1 hypothetical protein ABL78_1802 [Leptomonas seymouri]
MYPSAISRSSPLSPVERDLTAMIRADDDTLTHDRSTTAAGAVNLPRSASSWEMLDIADSSNAQDGVGIRATDIFSVESAGREEEAAALPAVTNEDVPAHVTPTKGPQSAQHEYDMRGDQQDTCAAATVAESNRSSLVNSASSGWSLLSTPSEKHLASAVTKGAQSSTLPYTLDDVQTVTIDGMVNPGMVDGEGTSAILLTASRAVPRAFLIGSSSPLPVSLIHASISASAAGGGGGDGWSTTSYEEVCMGDVLRSTGSATCTASSIVSTCTSPSPSHSAAFCAVMGVLPHAAEVPSELSEPLQGEEKEVAGAPMPPHQGTTPTHQAPWRTEQLRGLPLPFAAASAGAAKAMATPPATWPARRLSFLSSSAATVALSAAVIPPTLLTGFADIPAPLSHPHVDAAAQSAPSQSPRWSSSLPSAPSFFAFPLTAEATQWWSQACVVCSEGSQQALRSLHSVCGYVWMDLKNHWYPQLRLVLGDHSCAAKVRRAHSANRHVPHLKAKKRAPDPSEDNGEHALPRSMSVPSWISGETRILQASNPASMTADGKAKHRQSEEGYNDDHTVRSTRCGLQPFFNMAADAVGWAAQGLLVFLL